MTSPAPPSPGRRELNKTRTREAIVGALRELAERRHLAEVTVDDLAEQAGISRRTFFNYYGSISAVLSETFSGYAAGLVAAVDRELFATDPVGAFRHLVQQQGVPADFIAWLAALNCHGPMTEGSVLIERAVWADLAGWLESALVQLLPEGTDPLYVSTLASGVMGTFSAAEKTWLAGLAPQEGLTPSPETISTFTTHLDRALSYLAQGWRPQP